MSLLNNIKRALGFGYDEEHDQDEIDLNDSRQELTAFVQPAEASVGEAEIDEAHVWQVLDGVIAVFNEAQPEFVRQSLSTDTQRRLLYDRLDSDLRTWLEGLATSTRLNCEQRVAGEQAQQEAEISRLRGESERLARQREEIKQQQVSADRQKRALADRLRDLEAQVAELEAQREQTELVNRGLVNKIKVMSMQSGVNPDEISEAEPVDTEALNSTIKEKDERISALEAELANAKAKLEEIAEQHRQLSSEHAELNDKCAIAEHMADDLRRKASEAMAALKKKEEELLQATVDAKVVADLQTKMEGVAEVITRRDEKIKRLRARVAELESQLPKKDASIDFEAPAEPAAAPAKEAPAEEPKPVRPHTTQAPTISDSDLVAVDRSFGYQPPKRVVGHDNDAQLSLNFD